MKHTTIEVNKLVKSPLNARRTASKAAAEDMKASILAHGLMQNLVVTEDGERGYRVIAGGRRLAALRELQEEGKLPGNHAVACQIVTDEHALELSLAENTVRLAMHPADEFEAYATLIDDGSTVEQVAERFGATVRHVEQRLTLGNVAPELLAAYRDERLTLDHLMAFTITDDRNKQLRVFETLEEWHGARDIREMLTGEMAEATSKLARFVGLDAYHAAGGISRADLFGEEVYLENADLLHRLAGEKLESVRLQLDAEGWKWVAISPDRDWKVIHGCGRIYPQPGEAPQELLDMKCRTETEIEDLQQALEDTESDDLIEAVEEAEERLAGIEEKLESFASFDSQELAAAGCYVSIGHDGELLVERGLVKREDMKCLADDGVVPTPKPKGMPETLRRDLESYRLQAAQAEIARHRLVALDLLIFTTACSLFGKRPTHALDVQMRTHHGTPNVQRTHTVASDALQSIREELPLQWLQHKTEAEQFQAFIGLSDNAKLDLLAYCVATTLQPQLSTGNESTASEVALSLTDASMAAYWRPTRSNYLGRISRDRLLALGRELLGDQWAQARTSDKKGALADALERAFAAPERIARSPQQLEKLKDWLPEGMPFGMAPVNQLVSETHQRKAA